MRVEEILNMFLIKSIKLDKTLGQFLNASEGGNIGRRTGPELQSNYQNLDQQLYWNLYQDFEDSYRFVLESEVDKYQLIQYPNVRKLELEKVEKFLT